VNKNVKKYKMKTTEFDNFTDHLYDVIFQETCNYISDCIGSDGWGEEYHELHGDIMFRVVERMYNDMTKK
jgi:hypothetical protein